MLKPWYAIATPHEDIQKGRLEEAVFEANIWAVVQKTAPEVYLEPEKFFRKTYMTVGLATVLKRAASALREKVRVETGSSVFRRPSEAENSYPGGVVHLAKHAETLKECSASEELRRAWEVTGRKAFAALPFSPMPPVTQARGE